MHKARIEPQHQPGAVLPLSYPVPYLFMAFSTSSLALAAFSYSARSHFRRWSSGLEPPARSSPDLLPFSFSAIMCCSFYICKSEIKADVPYVHVIICVFFFVKKNLAEHGTETQEKCLVVFLMQGRQSTRSITVMHSNAAVFTIVKCCFLFLLLFLSAFPPH
jgi:hypothetical protein